MKIIELNIDNVSDIYKNRSRDFTTYDLITMAQSDVAGNKIRYYVEVDEQWMFIDALVLSNFLSATISMVEGFIPQS